MLNLQEVQNKLISELQQKWETIYNDCKGDEWPVCPDIEQYQNLPEFVKKELVETYNCSLFDTWKIFFTDIKKFPIYYHNENNGGGTSFGQEYIRIIQDRYKNINYCYEWCSGPGFIGYSILEHELCDNLVLTDMWAPAITDAEYTRSQLDIELQQRTTIHLLKDISLLPLNHQFDLVVANPPHYKTDPLAHLGGDYQFDNVGLHDVRVYTDLDWQTHLNFFQNIKKNLSAKGIILLQENDQGSTAEDFRNMIEENGLVITDVFPSTLMNSIYYIEIMHAT